MNYIFFPMKTVQTSYNRVLSLATLLLMCGFLLKCQPAEESYYTYDGQNALELKSPDKDMTLFLEAMPEHGILFTLQYKGKNIIAPSSLGLMIQEELPILAQPEIDQVIPCQLTAESAGYEEAVNQLNVFIRDKERSDFKLKLSCRLYSRGIFAFHYNIISETEKTLELTGEATMVNLADENGIFFLETGEEFACHTGTEMPVFFHTNDTWGRICGAPPHLSMAVERLENSLHITQQQNTIVTKFPYRLQWRVITIADNKEEMENVRLPHSLY